MTASPYCNTALFHISLLLDGELEVALQERLEEHFASCLNCLQVKEELERNEFRLKEALPQSLSQSSFPQEVWVGVQNKLATNVLSLREHQLRRTANARFSNVVLQLTAASLLFGLFYIGYFLSTGESLFPRSSSLAKIEEEAFSYATYRHQEKLLQQGRFLELSEFEDLHFSMALSKEYPEIPLRFKGEGQPQLVLFKKQTGEITLDVYCSQLQIQLRSEGLELQAKNAQFKLHFYHSSIQPDLSYSSYFSSNPFAVYASDLLQFSLSLYSGEVSLVTPSRTFRVQKGTTARFTTPTSTTKGLEELGVEAEISIKEWAKNLATQLRKPLTELPLRWRSTLSTIPPLVSSSTILPPPSDFEASVQVKKLQKSQKYSVKLKWQPVIVENGTVGYYVYKILEGQKVCLNPQQKLLDGTEFEDNSNISSVLSNTYHYYVESVLNQDGKEIRSQELSYVDITVHPQIQFSYQGGNDTNALFEVTLMQGGTVHQHSFPVESGKFIGKKKGDLDFSSGFKLIRIYQEKQPNFFIRKNGDKVEKVEMEPLSVRKVELYNPETRETIHLSKVSK